MKRKILIPIAGICLLALAVFGAYRVDMERMAKEEPVVFGTWGCDYCPPEEAPQGKADGEEPPAGDGPGGAAALYLSVLNDLWEKDSGLNSGVDYISVDLSAAPIRLTAEECTHLAQTFAAAHGAQGLTLTIDELDEQGYLTAQPLEGTDQVWRSLENGILFRITGEAGGLEGQPGSGQTIRFTADKWRSPLGAYGFSDCTATCDAGGEWGGYSIGGEFIS